MAGVVRWPDYRSREWPNAIKILHHKTGANRLASSGRNIGWNGYENSTPKPSRFWHNFPVVVCEIKTRSGVAFKPYSYSGFEKIVQQLRKRINGLPSYFTLDACRHGGMTELEEAALTEGQGRALSGHKTAQAYRGYAKETFDRALSATRKRHAHRLANETATNVRNEERIGVRNENLEPKVSDAK